MFTIAKKVDEAFQVPENKAYACREKHEMIQAKVVCNCGNEFVTGSTKKDIHVEICSKCHSFYTGQQKAASARGRIEMFNRKYGMKTDK